MAGDYTYKSDYVTEATTVLLIPDYRNSPDLVAIISSYSQQLQDLEDDLRDIIAQTVVPGGEGVQLDRIGKVIGQARWGRTDADYRRLILARVVANSSGGTPEDQIALILALFPTAAPVVYRRMGICYFEMDYELPSPSTQADRDALDNLLETSAPAGVGFGARETTDSPSPSFQLDTPGSGYDDGYLNTEVTASA